VKLLLALGSGDAFHSLPLRVRARGFTVARYANVPKAMDNLDELDPDAIVMSARDYPRHWKTFVQFARSERSRTACPIVLLTGDVFPPEEAAKATHLRVNGVIPESGLDAALPRFLELLEPGAALRRRYGFVFVWDGEIIAGELTAVSPRSLSYRPDHLPPTLSPGDELAECSLRAGAAMLNPVCRVTRIDRDLDAEFARFGSEDERDALVNALADRAPSR